MAAAVRQVPYWRDRIDTVKAKLARLRGAPPLSQSIPVTELRRGDRFWFGGHVVRVVGTITAEELLEVRAVCGDDEMYPTFLPFECVAVALPRPEP